MLFRSKDLTLEGPFIEREMALVKVVANGEKRVESLRIGDVFKARVVDATINSFVFELTGTADDLDRFIDLMQQLGEVDISRTGAAALSRGTSTL